MHHPADLKVVNRDKLHQRISNLPTWAVPPPAALEAVIRSVTGADNLEWDPMANGTIALKFDTEQVWMARQNIKIYITYRPSVPKVDLKMCSINFFALFVNATYGGPCGDNGAWWNATAPTTPPVREAVCFSSDGRVPYYFTFVNPSGETAAPSFLKVSHFVLGTPPSDLFKIPSTCPCAGTTLVGSGYSAPGQSSTSSPWTQPPAQQQQTWNGPGGGSTPSAYPPQPQQLPAQAQGGAPYPGQQPPPPPGQQGGGYPQQPQQQQPTWNAGQQGGGYPPQGGPPQPQPQAPGQQGGGGGGADVAKTSYPASPQPTWQAPGPGPTGGAYPGPQGQQQPPHGGYPPQGQQQQPGGPGGGWNQQQQTPQPGGGQPGGPAYPQQPQQGGGGGGGYPPYGGASYPPQQQQQPGGPGGGWSQQQQQPAYPQQQAQGGGYPQSSAWGAQGQGQQQVGWGGPPAGAQQQQPQGVGGPPAVMMPTSATVYTKTTTYGAAAPGPAYGGAGGYPPQQAPSTGGPWGGLAAPSSSSFASLPPKSFNVTQGWLAYYGQPSPDEMMILREWFNAVDQDGSGEIDSEELQRALAASGDNFDKQALELMVSMFDDTGSGQIDISGAAHCSSLGFVTMSSRVRLT
ncbi:EF hand domain containing protein [Acanthamoeba castellanii str. Neff]|uniref:EF hand domain containing protein n=1 Tax=Acanthamoeba castellanii (strain ATCC 30010 / Neff) TaxID=1257118 RepID=L8GC44_ACACF|nr:EF hand domain containing protein [Acanthamoeba castellanii str. Neff]ELR10795.1 EF hand domain containing protein [Acanthamoeba castellanii str. Neff]